ncbi:MAG: hypothetical protein Hyperionvirus7_86 [Hyperionvirus sp.]|uniref:Uncharacterized protein n=1 Tax=Hyperionvirus sp. TaxID=2487770 RepID=A0A3G5A8D0_9VIRU|nr:MAG: hypothetical protein Hyperionvirus7_86 [Hyperionvirus sp.]
MALTLIPESKNYVKKYFDKNNDVYILYMAQLIQVFMSQLVAGEISYRGIKLEWVVNYLNYADKFRPIEITLDRNIQRFRSIRANNVIEYIDKYVIAGKDWRPNYDWKRRRLSVMEFDKIQVTEWDSKVVSYQDFMVCLVGEKEFEHFGLNGYRNDKNEYINYSVKHQGSLNLVEYDRDNLIVSNYPNYVRYCRGSSKFIVGGNAMKNGLVSLFESEFSMKVPVHLYVNILNVNRSVSQGEWKISVDNTFVSYSEIDGFRLSRNACKYGLYEVFESEFGIKIPLTRGGCEELFSKGRMKKKGLRENVRSKIMKYFFDYDRVRVKRVLRIDGDKNGRVIVVNRRYVKNSCCGIVDTLLLRWGSDDAGVSIGELVKGILLEVANSFEISDARNLDKELRKFAEILGGFCLTIEAPKLTTAYHLGGPYESHCSFDSSTNQTNFSVNDIRSNKKTFDIEMTSGKEFKILMATEEHLTATGDLIVWKGVYIADEYPGIAKLIIPKNAEIHQNTEGMKFRTNRCLVDTIYQIDIYECFNCTKAGVFSYNGILYCSGCVTLIVKEFEGKVDGDIKLIDITMCKEVEGARAPYHSFEYKKNQNIVISYFKLERSNCDKAGIYFFFRLEQVLDYMTVEKFKPRFKQEGKIKKESERKEPEPAPEPEPSAEAINVLRRRSNIFPMETAAVASPPAKKPKDDKCSIQ